MLLCLGATSPSKDTAAVYVNAVTPPLSTDNFTGSTDTDYMYAITPGGLGIGSARKTDNSIPSANLNKGPHQQNRSFDLIRSVSEPGNPSPCSSPQEQPGKGEEEEEGVVSSEEVEEHIYTSVSHDTVDYSKCCQ